MKKEKRKISNSEIVKHAAYAKCLTTIKKNLPKFLKEFSDNFMGKRIQLMNGDTSAPLRAFVSKYPFIYQLKIYSWNSIYITVVAEVRMELPCKNIVWRDEPNEYGNRQYDVVESTEWVTGRVCQELYIGRTVLQCLDAITTNDYEKVVMVPLNKFYALVDKHQEHIDQARKIQSLIGWAHDFRNII